MTASELAPVGISHVLLRRWWVLLLCMLLVAGTALVLASAQSPRYQASAQVLLTDLSAFGVSDTSGTSINQAADRVVQTQADLARSNEVLQLVVSDLEVPGLSSQTLSANSSVTPLQNSNILSFVVTWGSSPDAQRIASAYAQGFIDYLQDSRRKQIEAGLSGIGAKLESLQQSGQSDSTAAQALRDSASKLQASLGLVSNGVTYLGPANSATQVWPRLVPTGVAACIFGLLLGALLIALLERIDTRIRSIEELENVLGSPVLGSLPQYRKLDDGWSPDLSDLTEDEEYRALLSRIEFSARSGGLGTLLISSDEPGLGKSLVAAKVGVAAAKAGRTVAIVDLDLGTPHQHKLFGQSRSPGIVDVALGRGPLQGTINRVPLPGAVAGDDPAAARADKGAGGGSLFVLTAGSSVTHPGAFITGPFLSPVMRQLSGPADLVVVECSPIHELPDMRVLATAADGLVVVLQGDKIRRPVVQGIRRDLAALPVPVLGAVLVGQMTHRRQAGDSGRTVTDLRRHVRDGSEQAEPVDQQ